MDTAAAVSVVIVMATMSASLVLMVVYVGKMLRMFRENNRHMIEHLSFPTELWVAASRASTGEDFFNRLMPGAYSTGRRPVKAKTDDDVEIVPGGPGVGEGDLTEFSESMPEPAGGQP